MPTLPRPSPSTIDKPKSKRSPSSTVILCQSYNALMLAPNIILTMSQLTPSSPSLSLFDICIKEKLLSKLPNNQPGNSYHTESSAILQLPNETMKQSTSVISQTSISYPSETSTSPSSPNKLAISTPCSDQLWAVSKSFCLFFSLISN